MVERNHGFPTKPQSYATLERISLAVRRSLLPDLGEIDGVPGVTLFEHLDDLTIDLGDVQVGVNYAVNPLPAGIEGLTVFDEERHEVVVVLDPDTYISLVAKDPRALFCLCHEIGHACIHTRVLMRLSRIPHSLAALHRGEIPQHKVFEDTEWQANAFAAAFLAPALGLIQLERRKGIITPEMLKRQYNTSPDTARFRIDIFQRRREELFKIGY